MKLEFFLLVLLASLVSSQDTSTVLSPTAAPTQATTTLQLPAT